MPALPDHDDGHAEDLLRELAAVSTRDPRWEQIRSELVRMHTPLARYIAHRYARNDEPVEDVEQAALLGLVKAINRYRPGRGESFLAYASPTMTGEVKRHFRDRTWALRMPRRLQDLRLSMRAARNDFTQEHGRAPTVTEIARMLELSEEDTIEALAAAEAYRPMSLDVPVTDEEGSETLAEQIGDDDPEIETAVDRTAVRVLLDQLPSRERMILLYRFFGNKTQTEIAKHVGISQIQVSRLITRSLAHLRTQMLQEV